MGVTGRPAPAVRHLASGCGGERVAGVPVAISWACGPPEMGVCSAGASSPSGGLPGAMCTVGPPRLGPPMGPLCRAPDMRCQPGARVARPPAAWDPKPLAPRGGCPVGFCGGSVTGGSCSSVQTF